MSERSKKLAHYIRRAKERQSTTSQDNQGELLDKGFAFLKIDIEREFHNQISDVNQAERTAEIKGKEPINFYYFIQVKVAKDETKWCYVGGENIAELASISCKLDTVVEEALFALFGIET